MTYRNIIKAVALVTALTTLGFSSTAHAGILNSITKAVKSIHKPVTVVKPNPIAVSAAEAKNEPSVNKVRDSKFPYIDKLDLYAKHNVRGLPKRPKVHPIEVFFDEVLSPLPGPTRDEDEMGPKYQERMKQERLLRIAEQENLELQRRLAEDRRRRKAEAEAAEEKRKADAYRDQQRRYNRGESLEHGDRFGGRDRNGNEPAFHDALGHVKT